MRFLGEPVLARFPDGAVEATLRVDCPHPEALAGARVDFAFDFALDGAFEPGTPSALSPADCADGALTLRRDLFPRAPGLLRAELRDGNDSLRDARAAFAGEAGSLLRLRRICARPRNGEPEWIEVANLARAPVSLHAARLEGRLLSGILGAGESLVAAGASDTAELRLWQPGARVFALSSWSPLRNSGDTARLAARVEWKGPGSSPMTVYVPLDSVVFPVPAAPSGASREACASAETEAASAAAHGFALEVPARWRSRSEALEVVVAAPSQGRYALRVYDLGGLERCPPSRGAGPGRHVLEPGACALPPGLPALILLLEPAGAPRVRARVRLVP